MKRNVWRCKTSVTSVWRYSILSEWTLNDSVHTTLHAERNHWAQYTNGQMFKPSNELKWSSKSSQVLQTIGKERESTGTKTREEQAGNSPLNVNGRNTPTKVTETWRLHFVKQFNYFCQQGTNVTQQVRRIKKVFSKTYFIFSIICICVCVSVCGDIYLSI